MSEYKSKQNFIEIVVPENKKIDMPITDFNIDFEVPDENIHMETFQFKNPRPGVFAEGEHAKSPLNQAVK